MLQSREAGATIVIPVFNQLAFTRQCLDRIARHTRDVPHDVIVVDNGSTDGTAAYFTEGSHPPTLRYVRNERNIGFAGANNVGARAAKHARLLFLNNDTLVAPGWLSAMMAVALSDSRIGIVGIKQLFPYTRTVYHCGIVFTRGPRPIHLYPHADGDAPHVNKQRDYQAVNGACLLIGAELFSACGGFDEQYVNGYEDVDLCLAVRQRGFRVTCCTSACIFHYAQTSEGRTADDPGNLARLVSKWRHAIRVDEDEYFRQDARDIASSVGKPAVSTSRAAPDVGDDGARSPYWRGTRVSVIVPAGERAAYLRAQVDALARQTVLPDEFETIIADYSPVAAEPANIARGLPGAVRYHRVREDPRPGAARNAAVALARGELILFLGETCVPGDRLLEEHLLAHARAPDREVAVVGHLDWPPSRDGRTLMQTVCAPRVRPVDGADASSADLDVLRLDLANASFKRSFLADAWASGIRINPGLTLTAFQGADLAVHLKPSGLRVQEAPDACAYENEPTTFDGLLAREFAAGADTVTLFRAHPQLGGVLDVAGMPDAETGAKRLSAHPQLRTALCDFTARTDAQIGKLVQSLDESIRLKEESPGATGTGDSRLLDGLRAAAELACRMSRTKAKVRWWYAAAGDAETAGDAEPLIVAVRTIEWLAAPAHRWTSPERVREIEPRQAPGAAVTRERRRLIRRALMIAASRIGIKSRLRALDASIESRLSRRKNGRWLARYLAVRARLRPYVV